ncbi:hypothetical protein ACN08Y_05995 [Rothia sp. P5764]|uniref:hypothetical protein n=1 Tax=Rothia sp. P5764 TaxID=3402654 RepID=UPI003AC910CF
MVAVLVRLKLAHFIAYFTRGNAWAIVGFSFAMLYGLGLVVCLGAGGFFIDNASGAQVFLALVGGILTLAWFLVPLFASAADATLDPERLAPYPIRVKDLMLGQAIGALVGAPGILTLLIALASATSLFFSIPGLLTYPVAAILGLALAIAGSRVVTLASIPLRARRGISNLLTIASFMVVMLMGPIIVGAAGGIAQVADRLPEYIEVLQWLPLLTPWLIPVHVASGSYGLAGALLALSLLYLAIIWWFWYLLTARTMANVGEVTGRKEARNLGTGHLGILDRFPATVRGTIAARIVQMMFKDPRCTVNVMSLPLFYLIFTFMGNLSVTTDTGEDVSTPIMGVFFCSAFIPAFAGYIYAYLVSYESTAFSLHTTTAVRGIDDRLGRAYAMILIYAPMILMGTLLFGLIAGAGAYTVPMLVTAYSVFFLGMGLASYADTVFSLPVPPPGSSPWKTAKQPDGMAKAFVRGLTMMIPMFLAAPGLAGMAASAINGNMLWAWLGAGVMLVMAVGGFTLGIRLGSQRFERHSADMLYRVTQFS